MGMPRTAMAAMEHAGLVEPGGDMDGVWELIRTGDARVDAAEYGAAIEAYHDALKTLSTRPQWSSQLNMVRNTLAEAHEGAFGLDADVIHLRKAKVLLGEYLGNLAADSGDRAAAETRLAAIEAKLEQLGTASAPTAEVADANLVEKEDEQSQGSVVLEKTTPRDAPEAAERAGIPGQKLIFVGGGVAALGAVALGPTIYGAVEWRRQQRTGRQGVENGESQATLDEIQIRRDLAALITGAAGVAAAVFVVAGVTLIVVGRMKRGSAGRTAVVPQLWRGGAGFGWVGRF